MGVEGEGTGARLDGLFADSRSGDAPLFVIEAAAPANAAVKALSIGPLAAAATVGGPHRRAHDATCAAREDAAVDVHLSRVSMNDSRTGEREGRPVEGHDWAMDLSTHLARLYAADPAWLPLRAASSHWAIRNDPPFHTF